MRLIVIGILIVLAIILIIAGAKNKWRISWLGVCVLLIPAGVLGWFEYEWQEWKGEMTSIVHEVTEDRSKNFNCERLTMSLFDAFVADKTITTDPNTVFPKYATCATLKAWYKQANGDEGIIEEPNKEQIDAIAVFANDIFRVKGENDGQLRQCLTQKNYSAIAQRLGTEKDLADWMQAKYIKSLSWKKLSKAYC